MPLCAAREHEFFLSAHIDSISSSAFTAQ